jgi:hypothetical protein
VPKAERKGTTGYKQSEAWEKLENVNTSAANQQIGKIKKEDFTRLMSAMVKIYINLIALIKRVKFI